MYVHVTSAVFVCMLSIHLQLTHLASVSLLLVFAFIHVVFEN